MSGRIFVPVVCGPTASGKTALGVELAKQLDGEIISADSMQIYTGMEIASAKPTEEEKQGIPHHLMDFLSPSCPFSVADYTQLAHKCIQDVHSRGKLPIMVGGTGLYISSVIDNITFDDTGSDLSFRAEMKSFARANGNVALWQKLEKIDPITAKRLHPNNLNRVIRALEVYHISGETISSVQERSRLNESPYEPFFIMPDFPREQLYLRIDRRVDDMLSRGLVEEAREFFTHNDYVTSAQAIGYKELKPYLDGEKDLTECTDKLKQATRNYAKRQLTWFNKEPRLNKISADELQSEIKICEIIKNLVKRYSFFKNNMV